MTAGRLRVPDDMNADTPAMAITSSEWMHATERKKEPTNPDEGWGRRTGSTPARKGVDALTARAGFWKDDQGDRGTGGALLLLTRDTTGSQRGARWTPTSTGGLISV